MANYEGSIYILLVIMILLAIVLVMGVVVFLCLLCYYFCKPHNEYEQHQEIELTNI